MNDFLSTTEYRVLCAMFKRLKVVNTEVNMAKFMEQKVRCVELANEKYNDQGWIERTNSYSWDTFDMRLTAPSSIRGFSKAFDKPVFAAIDKSQIVVKEDEGVFVTYTRAELDELRGASPGERARIHQVKLAFEGSNVIEGKTDREEDQDVAEQTDQGVLF